MTTIHTIDTHSHFNLEQFSADRGEAIARMQEAGIGTITIGIDLATSVLAVAIARTNEGLWACIGQHPTEKNAFEMVDFRQLIEQDKSLPRHEQKIVAIGECGLDYFREEDRVRKQEQKMVFAAQIALAQEYNLPLMLHIRPSHGTMDAYEDALEMLEQVAGNTGTVSGDSHSPYSAGDHSAIANTSVATALRGTAHFFVGDTFVADRFLALGFHISFSGVITFASEYSAVVAHVPLSRILSETDAPFAAPVPHRGKRNEPAFVGSIVHKIAEIKGISYQEVQQQLYHNAKTLFGL